jgi:transcriptional regulator with XRE-family HTH domain
MIIYLFKKQKMKIKKAKEKMYGNRIKAILKEKEMSIQELSDISGVPPSHLSRIINGQRRCISLPIAIKVSQALETAVEQVFMYKKPVEPAVLEDDNN